MARVLVVGSDMQGERALLQRLRSAASLTADGVSTCRDLDECDLLVIRDTPALRNAALRMVRERPRIQLWVEDQQGQLRDGERTNGPVLDDAAIEHALRHMVDSAPVPNIDEPCTARGAKAHSSLPATARTWPLSSTSRSTCASPPTAETSRSSS